jgi:hypothetical protein
MAGVNGTGDFRVRLTSDPFPALVPTKVAVIIWPSLPATDWRMMMA